jgi:hypothetical protein
MRDLRDPEALGKEYMNQRLRGLSIAQAVLLETPYYQDGLFISSDPANHHSKTPQNLGDLSDGGD